ncbi:MAG: phosphoenolpyruvate synthase [Thermoleophilia bacterium]|nr:phosphoenolpyruvate synthase [Thermoleophilia bacterium]
MDEFVVALERADRSQVALVGGKGANLGELSRIDGVVVPPGFCVTTAAFERVVAGDPALGRLVGELSLVGTDEHEAARVLSAELRDRIASAPIPERIEREIVAAVRRIGERTPWAVRSSATTEDSPTASFAGQHDTSLDVVGPTAVLEHVRRCWASLFTERAVAYRRRHDLAPSEERMAVVVQRMAPAQAAGVLFTADPVTGNRLVSVVEATTGSGEALVAGLVAPEVMRVRDDVLVGRTGAGRGTEVLTDRQAVSLAALGRRVEAHSGRPQDIEWCLVDGTFQVVQTRPITTLFPIPETGDGDRHVYVSVGHQQMMTDPMTPLGASFWQMTAGRPMFEAGGRMFVDVAGQLAAPASRAAVVDMLGRSDPLVGDALETVVSRGFIEARSDEPGRMPFGGPVPPIEADPAIPAELIVEAEASLAALSREIATLTGADLLAFIADDLEQRRRRQSERRSLQVLMAGIEAARWLNETLQEWLGEHRAADVLARSLPDNVTSRMGLALLDIADLARPCPEVLEVLENAPDDAFLERLPDVAGGRRVREAIEAFLDDYGMRCVGEIDIARPRWRERPLALVPLILANVTGFSPGAAAQLHRKGLQEAADKERDILERVHALPQGARRAAQAKRMIDQLRAFSGYREYPKYALVKRYFVYKQALMGEAATLARSGVLDDPSDVFWLRFDELHDVVLARRADRRMIEQRRDRHRTNHALQPPRVMTSDGEIISGAYRHHDLPHGALPGLAVSAGIAEGRARVVHDPADLDLEPGDILVTAYTDPSWTPAFPSIAGLVTEVGGLTTHGSVIAREYGVPAVVGVVDATRLITDGQWITVNGTSGHVEIHPA